LSRYFAGWTVQAEGDGQSAAAARASRFISKIRRCPESARQPASARAILPQDAVQ
jgi:hypothetical protein